MSRTVRRLRALSSAATLVVAALAVCLRAVPPAAAADARVQVVDDAFEPPNVTVQVGQTVTWTWTGEGRHSVTAPGRFDSHPDCTPVTPEDCGTTGATFSWAADQPGTVNYRCRVHPDRMQGTIVVEAATSPAPSPSATPTPTSSPSPTAAASPSPSPTSSPPPSPSPRPSPSPSPRFGPPSPRPTAPLPIVPASPTPEPAGTTSPDEPELEPFPAPADPSASPSEREDPLADDVVAVDAPGGEEPPWRAIAGVTFGVTLLAFGRVVLFGRPWF